MSSESNGSEKSKKDSKKLDAIRQINQILLDAASDVQFQQDLQEPMVQLAMDHWSGRAIHTSRANQIVDCSSVVNVYPRMKNLESICDSVGIKVPLDHIETKKSELSTEATRMAFGEVFLLEHGVAVDSVVSNGNLTPSEGKGIESYAITEFSDIARSAAWVKESVIDCFSIFSGGAISTPLKGQQLTIDAGNATTSPSTVTAAPFTPPFFENESRNSDDDTWKWQLSPKRPLNQSQALASFSVDEELQHKATYLVSVSMSRDSDSADTELPVAASHVIVMMFLYIACLACSLLYSGRYDLDCTADLPWIGSQNATNIVMERLKNIEMEYEAALLSGKWTCLQSEPNFTIEVMETESGQRPVYLRTTTVYPMKPEQLYKRFKSDNFDITMKTVNPLYESSKLLFSPATKFFFPANGIDIVKIISTPIFLMLPRRQLTAAIVEKVLGKSIRLKNVKVLNNDTEDGRHLIDPLGTKIPRGTLIKAMLTVNVDEGSLKQSNVLRTPINVSKTISPPEDSPLLKLCDSFTKYYLGSMGINYQLGMCHTMLSLPQTVLTHITRSLRTCDGLVADLISATTRYKRIRQDLISFFVPLRRGRTLLIVVTRLNPGDDIPNWLQNQLLTQRGITLLTSLKATPRDSQTSVQQGGN